MSTERTDQARHRAGGKHAAQDDAEVHPLIDLSRDPNPGVPDHAKSDDE